jgi:hypothetical protein
MDIALADHGSIVLLAPVSDAGREWCSEWIDDAGMRTGSAYVVEHRYVDAIVDGMIDAGLDVVPC